MTFQDSPAECAIGEGVLLSAFLDLHQSGNGSAYAGFVDSPESGDIIFKESPEGGTDFGWVRKS